MSSSIEKPSVSQPMLWSGRIISALPLLLILFGSVMKLAHTASVVEGFNKAGYPEDRILIVGLIEFVCSIVFLIPRTRVLGAILLTGLLGGATATNVRVGDPAVIAPILCGILLWTGLLLQDRNVRELLPRW